MTTSRHIRIGPVTCGNDLPLTLIAGPCQLESLKQSVASSNLTSAQAEAHTLKGASGNIGAEQMMELFAAIEAAAGEEQMQEVEALLKQVDDSYRRLESELRS